MRSVHRPTVLASCFLLLAAIAAACGTSDSSEFPDKGKTDGGGGGGSSGFIDPDQDGASPPDPNAQDFDVDPVGPQTITLTVGQPFPTVTFDAQRNGAPVNVAWTVDRGEVGLVTPGPSAQGVFTPSGATGGMVKVIAGLNGKTVERQVFVKIVAQTQNGANASAPGEAAQIPSSVADLGAGGGVGGVGGEGLGGPVSDAATVTALGAPTSNGSSQNLTLLYPYDKTVFPRGLLAPLLQWSSTLGGVDAIQIKLATTSGSFSWTGTFAKPAILTQTGGPFVRHPIPQDVWAMATNSAGGPTTDGSVDRLTVSLVVAKGGVGYGPLTETWTVAPGRLAGTVYYNSYGTALIKNSNDNDKNGVQYGAAVLGIREGQTGPTVVAGNASDYSGSGCRVCHTVAQNGSRLLVQHGESYSSTSAYDLKNNNAEGPLTGYDNLFGWAGLSPDGQLALTNAADLAASAPATRLYPMPPTSTTPIAVTGIPNDLKGGTPSFSPDMKHVAFDFLGGTIGNLTGDGTKLVAMDFDQQAKVFSNLRVLATMTGGKRAGFPSFFPTNDAVAFHYQIVSSNHRYNTWHSATAQVWWSDLATGTAKALEQLNGLNAGGATSYLPTGPNNHGNDSVLNYEPTVNPVASGGYIWVVFTSRRLYGNVAVTDPWQSDPRNYDMTKVANATTKKLWVAAIDLNAPAGTDPSHPAFYLPAQELLAGNARGFWVLDPCRSDGMNCQSGDQCCNGYCQPPPGNAAGALVCSDKPPTATCSKVQEKCTTAGDCCDKSNGCVNGFCAVTAPK